MKTIIEKQIFLNVLPLYPNGRHKSEINWKQSINCKVEFKYQNIKGSILIKNYIKGKVPKLKVEYNDKEFDISTINFKNCNLGRIIGKKTKDFKINIGENFISNKVNITIIDRKIIKVEKMIKGTKQFVDRKYYKYKCNLCGFECGEHYKSGEYKEEMWVEEKILLSDNFCCSSCCKSPVIVVRGINDITTTAPWMIPYVGEEIAISHTCKSGDYINPKCPYCGEIKEKPMRIIKIYSKHSIACSCSDKISYPNKFMFQLLNQLNITFIREYSPDWINSKSYDFYFKLNNKKYILEMDGWFHSNNNSMNGQTKEESKAIDDYKDKLAQEHNIQVIRIDCNYGDNDRFEFIKNNTIIELQNIVDLKFINWLKIDEYSCNNLVKIACEYKRNNPNLTPKQIGNIIGYSEDSVRKWLKIGNKHNWCEYLSYKNK